MSYQVLARKWRPQNFKQIVGQEHVLRALMNALDSDRLHHAYLFTGTRGVGKTTIARILAKCLNCETGITSTPCGECNSCREITAGNFLDLIEVDAASRTKVEDTRELLENVQYAPTRARFKVYLIDEVHMLTGHSFNALLKTLEEPPPHVKFLFATTDPQKLPATILSRCLQFNLKRMPVEMISEHLDYLLQQESIKFETPALRLLARAADGSMRDALSLLDQSIAYSGAEITEDLVRDMLGTVSHEPLIDLLELIIAAEGVKLLQQVDDLSSVTPDFAVATDALIMLLHQLAVQQVVPDAINKEQGIAELANKISKEEVQLFYQIALQGRRDLPLSPDPRSGFEMLLLRMMSFRPLREGMQLKSPATSPVVEDQSKKKTVISEQTTESSTETAPVSLLTKFAESEVKPSKPDQIKAESTPQPQTSQNQEVPPWEDIPDYLTENVVATSEDSITDTKTAINEAKAHSDSIEDLILQTNHEEENPEDIELDSEESFVNERDKQITSKAQQQTPVNVKTQVVDIKQPWHAIVPQLNLSGRANELIKHCILEKQDNGIISLLLDKEREDLYADTTKQEIQAAVINLFGDTTHFELRIAEATVNTATLDKSLETPAQRNSRKVSESQLQAEHNIETDPFIIALKDRFGAQLVPGSVQVKSSK